jgi:O-antigen ligase
MRTARLLDGFIFAGLLVLIVIVAIPYGTVDAWWEAIFECAIWLFTALWILRVALQGDSQIRRLSFLLPLVLIAVYAFAQTLIWPAWLAPAFTGLSAQRTLTIDRYQTFLTARKTLALTIFLALLFVHTSSPGRFRWLARVVVGVGLGSALFGILRQLLQSPDATNGFVLPFLYPGVGYGQFISPNVFAYLMEMTMALLAGLVFGGGLRRDRILIYLAMIIPIWAALVLSSSRGGIVGLICSIVFVLIISLSWYSSRRAARQDGGGNRWWILLGRSSWVRVLLVLVVVGTLVAGVFWMGGETLVSKMGRTSTPQDTIDGQSRQEIWRSTTRLIKQNPWTGAGFGTYFLAIPQHQNSSGTIKLEQAHQDYLDLAASGGVVAMILAAWFIFNIIWRARRALQSRDAYRRAACLGASAAILSIGIHSFVDFGLQITGIAVIFGAVLVIAIADERVEQRGGGAAGAH